MGCRFDIYGEGVGFVKIDGCVGERGPVGQADGHTDGEGAAMGAILPGNLLGQGIVGQGKAEDDFRTGEDKGAGLAIGLCATDGNKRTGRNNMEVELLLIDITALVHILAGVGAVFSDVGNDDYAAAHSACTPAVVIGPAGRVAKIEDYALAVEDSLLRSTVNGAINGNLGNSNVRHGIACNSDGEALFRGRAVGCGVGNAINMTAVGLYGELSSGLTRLPLP